MFTDRRFRLARIWSNKELRRIGSLCDGDVVNVSAGDDQDKEGSTYENYFPNAASYHLTNYMPGAFRGFSGKENEHLLDLRGELPAHLLRRFNIALSHTVLEHVFDMATAFKNTCELTDDLAIIIVPFAQIQHESESYQDFWRFTPRALRQLYELNGMNVVYEAWNQHRNASTYVISVASRKPERWMGKFPGKPLLSAPASGIGDGVVAKIVSAAQGLGNSIRKFSRAG